MTNKKVLSQIDRKVEELLAKMTLEEKLSQLRSYWMYDLQTNGILDEQKVAAKLKNESPTIFNII